MKVLIVSHNPITTFQSMGKTMLSLFSSFEKSEMCQLYIYPTVPDIDVCNSYFRITDRSVVKSFTEFGRIETRVIRDSDINTDRHELYENEKEAEFFKNKKKNSANLLCRDFLWSVSNWYNTSLKEWLEKEKPTCIFLAPGESKFIYNIALRISRKLGINLYTYICDDYCFVQSTKNPIECLQLYLLKRKIVLAMKSSKKIITICDELAEAYQREFQVKAQCILTGSNYQIPERALNYQKINGMTYMGNLDYNRYLSIAEIGKVLDIINRKNRTEYSIFLYTPPLNNKVKQLFSTIKSIHYCGYVTGDRFTETLKNSPILLHVESFNPQSIDLVKYSISTKISEGLGSGNLLFAYGPKEVASIRYLIKNNCAIVSTSKGDLEQMLYAALHCKCREEIIERALIIAKDKHYSIKNSMFLREIMS